VLCVDENSQIQALDGSQPGLPLKRGRSQTLTHDCKRNGTAILLALSQSSERRGLRVLSETDSTTGMAQISGAMLDQAMPSHLDLHLIDDNYATHKHPKVQRWLVRHPRFHMHFTPTSASWLNMVEPFFRDLTQNRLRRGGTAHTSDILEKVKRARRALHKRHSAFRDLEIGILVVAVDLTADRHDNFDALH
jgi:DDE superfamily endonuclease